MKTLKLIPLAFTLVLGTANAQAPKAENDPNIDPQIRGFLKALNNSGGKAVEELSPADARLVLVGAQKSVDVDYSGIEETEKTITQDGATIKIHIVKPKGAKSD